MRVVRGSGGKILGVKGMSSLELKTFSRFGGLWIDREDAAIILGQRRKRGEFSPELADRIEMFMRDGRIVIKQAVGKDVTAQIRAELLDYWTNPPEGAVIENWTKEGKQQLVRPEISLRDGVTKLLDFHAFSVTARKAIAAPKVIEFLAAIFDAKPKAFQSIVFWKGSQQAIHKDTAYVQVDGEPMHLAATWLALEDVRAGAGGLEYYVGSHRTPEFLFGGRHKWMEYAPQDHNRFLASLHEDAKTYGLQKETFMPAEGDVLIWHADLAHGGGQITNPNATRQSLVTHFTSEKNNPSYMKTCHRVPVIEGNCIFISQFKQIETSAFPE